MKQVNKDFLESEIVDVEYTRLKGTLTHCAITVKNGFIFTAESACIDEENFDEEIGKMLAYERAFSEMYSHYAFLVKQKTGGTPIDRMQIELDDLHDKMDKLGKFVAKPKPDFLDDNEWALLHEQQEHMVNYYNVLVARLAIAKSKQVELC